jgi:hypothetical protein
MSDGAPMQFNYFSGRSRSQGWVDWILGNIDQDKLKAEFYTQENPPEGLSTMETNLLNLLKDGKLVRPEYQRDNWNGWIYEDKAAAQKQDSTKRKRAYEYAGSNYLLRVGLIAGDEQYFYDYMDHHGYDLDWDYLCDIAKANGIEDFDYDYYQNNKELQQLTDKLLKYNGKSTYLVGYEWDADDQKAYAVYKTDLKNPSLEEKQYYPKGTGDDFFEAMESIGVECGWDLFAKIAYKNGQDVTALVKKMRVVPSGFTHATASPYTYFYNAEGRNWWAEAIKGDPDTLYPVVNRYAEEDCTEQAITYYGDVRNNFDTGTGLPLDGQRHISGFRGLGIDIYSVSFSMAADNKITAADA